MTFQIILTLAIIFSLNEIRMRKFTKINGEQNIKDFLSKIDLSKCTVIKKDIYFNTLFLVCSDGHTFIIKNYDKDSESILDNHKIKT